MTASPYGLHRTVTELGEEKRCMSCGEYWPADSEFFEVMQSRRDGWSPRCIACIRAKTWQLARAGLPGAANRQGIERDAPAGGR